ncbi:lysozyme [Agrobacterium rosae]|uniref:lysozyme n=1 Tax=Agrobacterium rosae TaxID=1972867 RepID=UPI003BA133C0
MAPVNKITSSKRGKAAVATAAIAAALSGWFAFSGGQQPQTPAQVRSAISQGVTPPAVAMAVRVIKSWEGLETVAYLDRLPTVPVWTVCYGETKGVKPGMRFTPSECEEMLKRRVAQDYYLPLVDGVTAFLKAPDSVQASLISGAYNYGVAGARGSSGARLITQGKYRQACYALTAWNKAGGRVLKGLVNRREMGDANRIGEAELCVSGL